MTQRWQPFNMTDDEYEQHQVLVDGVPTWMRESLVTLICNSFTDSYNNLVYHDLRLSYLRQSKRDFPAGKFWHNIAPLLMEYKSYDLLLLTDFLVNRYGQTTAKTYEAVLSEAGSKWKAGYKGDAWGLSERVNETVQVAADQAIKTGGTAGEHLGRAWGQAYGRAGDPGEAFRHAIRAVEAAVKPIVSPNDSGATLGKMAGQMAKDGNWSLPFQREDNRLGTADTVVAMMRNLYAGQHDRHGDLEALTTRVTAAEAQAAVTMAVALVQWFSSGAIQRRS